MQLRRALPLTLAVLVMTAGCVTVRPPQPAGSPDAPGPTPAAARPASVPREPAPGAWPLGELPSPSLAPAREPVPRPPASVERAVREPAAPGRAAHARPAERVGPAGPVRPPKSVRPARPPARAAKPRERGPAPAAPKHRPAPRRSYDMAPLCTAARGTLDPSIAVLCTSRYGG